jgi:hypothetical protein
MFDVGERAHVFDDTKGSINRPEAFATFDGHLIFDRDIMTKADGRKILVHELFHLASRGRNVVAHTRDGMYVRVMSGLLRQPLNDGNEKIGRNKRFFLGLNEAITETMALLATESTAEQRFGEYAARNCMLLQILIRGVRRDRT